MITKSKCAIAAVLSLAAMAAQAELPPDVLHDIQREYASGDEASPIRYVEGLADLNADGKNELLVHLVGPSACDSGGCPTLVYTLLGSGYWRMATIGLTRLPISASATRTRGWRNLIVTVGGDAAEAGDAELAFDGRGYPKDPTQRGKYVTASAGGGDIVIAALASSGTAAVLPKAAKDQPSEHSAGSPSFACAEARLPAEKTVCASRELAAMDRRLNEAYSDAMESWPAGERNRQRAAQKQWLAQRNACSKTDDATLCLRDAYRRRQIDLQILSGTLPARVSKDYLCKGADSEPLTAAFYPTDPPAAVLTRGDRQVIAVATPSGDGTRYVATGIEFWEQEGGAHVEWNKEKFDCAVQ